MRIITLADQLSFAQKCLKIMQDTNREQNQIDLQESICWTLEARIKEKQVVNGYFLDTPAVER